MRCMRARTKNVWLSGWIVYEEDTESETEMRNVSRELEGRGFIGEGAPLPGQQLLF